MNFDKIKATLVKALDAAGVKEYEIYYQADESTEVGTLKHEVNAFSSSLGAGLCLRLVSDGKMGYASTELMEEGEMAQLVERAIENARATEKLDTIGIFKGSAHYESIPESDVVPLSAEQLKSLALDLHEQLYAADGRVADGTASDAQSASISVRLVNSHGLDLERHGALNIVVTQAVVNVDGEFESSFMIDKYSPDMDTSLMARQTVGDALDKIGAGEVNSGKYNVVFSSKQMRSLLGVFSSAFSAKNAQMGISLLRGKEGEVIAADIVNITDDPMREGLLIKSNFDAEGVATYRKSVVEGGVLKTLLHNRETAAAQGVESTGNASKAKYSSPVSISPTTFCLEAGEHTLDGLFELAGDGIYITELKGLHAGADAVTGDFSLESAGFIIKDGKKGAAVKSFTVAGNFFELLHQICALGNEVDLGMLGATSTIGAPHVLVRAMSVAGK